MLAVYCIVAAIAAVWLMLTMSAALSLRWTRAAPERRATLRLVMALTPVLLGLLLLNFHLRWQLNDVTMNLSSPFAVPILLGAFALFFWVRNRARRFHG